MIDFKHVTKRYPVGKGEHFALRALSFSVTPGELVFVTGHSGAGKSTLLRLITRMERPSAGEVVVNNRNLVRLPAWRVPQFRRELGIIFQDNKLLHDRTVYDNVALPLVAAGYASADISKRVHAALDLVGLLEKARLHPVVLSGGEQQRTGIARAIVNRPALLLADEPTGNLDHELSTHIFDLFTILNRHGTTVLIATHDLQQVARIGRRVISLQNGELIGDSVA